MSAHAWAVLCITAAAGLAYGLALALVAREARRLDRTRLPETTP